MNHQDLIRILETVPEKRLTLLDLVKKVVNEEGNIDMDHCLPLAQEITEAVKEASAYSRATEKVKWALQKLTEAH